MFFFDQKIIPQILSCSIRHEKNQVQKPETPEKILKGVSHNCQRLKEKMDSFRTPKVGIEPPTTEPTDSTAKAGAQASTTSKTLGEMKAPFGQVKV